MLISLRIIVVTVDFTIFGLTFVLASLIGYFTAFTIYLPLSVGFFLHILYLLLNTFIFHLKRTLTFLVSSVYWWISFFFLVSSLLQFWMIILLDRVFQVESFFLFSPLNISSYSILHCKVSTEKSADGFVGFPLYVISCFSFATLKISLFLLKVWHF